MTRNESDLARIVPSGTSSPKMAHSMTPIVVVPSVQSTPPDLVEVMLGKNEDNHQLAGADKKQAKDKVRNG